MEKLPNHSVLPDHDPSEGLHIDKSKEPLIHWLHVIIRCCVRILAVHDDLGDHVERRRCSLSALPTNDGIGGGVPERQ